MTDATAAPSEPYSLVAGDWREDPRTIHGPDGHMAGGLEPDDARRLCAELNRLAAQPPAGAQGEVREASAYRDGMAHGFKLGLAGDEAEYERQKAWRVDEIIKARKDLKATPAQPDTGDVEALREALDETLIYIENLGANIERNDVDMHLDTVERPYGFAQGMRCRIAALCAPVTSENDRFVAGPVWQETDITDEDGNIIWTSEVQTVGGWSVVATVHGATEDEAKQRRDACLAALSKPNAPGREG